MKHPKKINEQVWLKYSDKKLMKYQDELIQYICEHMSSEDETIFQALMIERELTLRENN